jgi:hypothetical protein
MEIRFVLRSLQEESQPLFSRVVNIELQNDPKPQVYSHFETFPAIKSSVLNS